VWSIFYPYDNKLIY